MNVSFLPVPPSNNPRALNRSIRKSVKTPLTMLLISLLLTTVARDTGLTCAKTEDTSHHVAETLLDLLKVSCEEVNALFLSLSNGSDITDDLVEAFAEAETLHEEAQAYFEVGEYDQAIDRATKAMNLYGRVASKIYEIQGKDEEQNEDDETEETFEPVELYSYYEKSLDRLERFKEITNEIENQEVEVSETLALILETESSLADMKEKLEHGDFEKAESMHRVVEDALEEVEGGLQSQSHEKRKEKAEHFIDQTRQRVQQLETKYDKVLDKHDVSNDETEGIHEEFQEILSALDEAEKDIDDDELDEAIEHLITIVKESKDVGKDQEGLEDELVENLNNLNDQDFILKTYLGRVRMLEGLGVDTVELDDLLGGIGRLLVDANKKINEGKNEDAEILIDDSDDLLDELDDLIDKLQEESEKPAEEATEDKETEEEDNEDDTNDNKAEVDETEKEEDNEELDEDPPEANEGDEVDEKETEDKDDEGESEEAEEDGDEENEEQDGSRRKKEESDYFKVWLEKIKERTAEYGESTDIPKKERMDTADLVKLFEKIHSSSKRTQDSEDIEEFSASMEELDEDIDDVDEGKKAENKGAEADEETGDDEIEEDAEEPEDDEKTGDEKTEEESREIENDEETEDYETEEKSRKIEENTEDTEAGDKQIKEETEEVENYEETEDDKTEKKSRKTEEKTRDNKTEDNENEEETDKAEDDESSHGRGHRNHRPQKGRSKHS